MTNHRILASLVLFVFAILGFSPTASAQEKIVALEKGSTVWQVLNNAGCSDEQIANVWRMVVADSGLDPKNDKSFAVGTPVVLRRDCQGNPLSNAALEALTAENNNLRDINEKFVADIKAMQAKSSAQEAHLKTVTEAKNFWQGWSLIFLCCIVAILVLVVLYRAHLGYKMHKLEKVLANERQGHILDINGLNANLRADAVRLEKVEQELKQANARLASQSAISVVEIPHPEDIVVIKKQVVVEHNGQEVVAHLKEAKPQYKCPFCEAEVLVYSKNFATHLRTHHGDHGRNNIINVDADADSDDNLLAFKSEAPRKSA